MDYSLTEEQSILKKTAGDFLKKECPKELVRELDETEKGYSPELWSKMAGLGWMGLMLPEQYGGSEFSFLDLTMLIEEMGYNICPGPFISTSISGGQPILTAGTEEQKQEILPKAATGEIILTMALTEPDAGFDASSIKAAAVLDNDEYVINGTKLFVYDANVADYLLCVARTGEGSNPEEGVTIFLVKTGAPGVTVTLLKTIARDKQCEVVFDNVRVPKKDVIGEVGQGWPVAKDTLEKAMIARCAEMIGGAQAASDLAREYAKERIQFERPIGSFQAIQHHFANMWIAINGSRNLIYKTAWKIAQGLPASQDVAITKARTGDTYRKVTTLSHQVFGGIGFTMEHDMHLYHRRSVAGDLSFGNADYQREEVAKGLGL